MPRGILQRWGYHKANGEPACRGATIPRPPNRTSACPHLKTFLKYGRRSGDVSKRREVAWIYVGSHNISKVAWGQLSNHDSQLYIRSYELGILISPHTLRGLIPLTPPHTTPHTPPTGSSSSSSSSSGAATPMRSFMWHKRDDAGPSPLPRMYAATARCPSGPPGVPLVGVPLPYPLPPVPYGPSDAVWTKDGTHTGRDSLGRAYDADQKSVREGFSRADF
ncbi:unnamed protein product [Vitrella brassicaformis CCMP3155]|uniref:Uncharacterized protein n=1 Tax=Vitrella brassicaformis (strain CCMP3155) TaxID=1169540 RepID=A0A0G4G5C1_VITBC|nr:unnamed protein product [Vitrella brassicaformis CCMP3155]|eukprot:CEM23744.1 unnamed protein product [Vitrella brassicaformis CCMP3155]